MGDPQLDDLTGEAPNDGFDMDGASLRSIGGDSANDSSGGRASVDALPNAKLDLYDSEVLGLCGGP